MVQPGKYEYEISFVTNRQLGFFDEHDELWWNVTGNGWSFPIDRVVATVDFPFRVPADGLELSVYMGRYGSTETSATAEVCERRARSASKRPGRSNPGKGCRWLSPGRRAWSNEPGAGQKNSLVPERQWRRSRPVAGFAGTIRLVLLGLEQGRPGPGKRESFYPASSRPKGCPRPPAAMSRTCLSTVIPSPLRSSAWR